MTKTTETWEERFDRLFPFSVHSCTHSGDGEKIKEFIRAEIALARQEGEKAGREKTVAFIRSVADLHEISGARFRAVSEQTLEEALTNPT